MNSVEDTNKKILKYGTVGKGCEKKIRRAVNIGC
jgi:hypothetical protein